MDEALSQVLFDQKEAFYLDLQGSYGLKPEDIPQHYDAFYDALLGLLSSEKYNQIIRKIIQILHKRSQNGTYPETIAVEAFSRIVTVNMEKTNARIKDRQKLYDEAKYKDKIIKEKDSKLHEQSIKLEEAQRLAAIGQTAGMVGHDIRNPLQAITGEIYLVKSELGSLPDNSAKSSIHESIRMIEENIRYINKIVSDLQDYAKTLVPNKSKIGIRELINSVMSMVVIPDNIEVAISIENHPLFSVDTDMTRRILTNLVQNAIQTMPNGGKLTIQACSKPTGVVISVADTGVGIPKEVKQKLFTPLFTTKSKGQGLGLAVVKRLVEVQGGTITFESEEGKGTTFIIDLPIGKE